MAGTEINQLIDHLFRHESGKLVSVLTRVFGPEKMDLAEDTVQDSLLEALNHWEYNGVPDNPSAWLFRVAKNKALNIINREEYTRQYVKAVSYARKDEIDKPEYDDLFSDKEIQDDQLRMIFTCCHPAISPDSQIALALKTLCGFSIPEIARAFLTTEENIHKRLVRARQNIREAEIPFEVPDGKDLEKRLQAVLETIYLLFNEGYSASKGEEIIRYELCEEAIRLAQIIVHSKSILKTGNVFALLSLMVLNTSRFMARQDNEGNLLTMAEQNRSLWDRNLQAEGLTYLQQATVNNGNGLYVILAAISAHYCIAPDYESTDWNSILSLYDDLIQLDKSPLVLLNRAIVISKLKGEVAALAELEYIQINPSVKSYHLFYSTRAEFYIQLGQFKNAINSLKTAIQLVQVKSERDLLNRKLIFCGEKVA